MRTVRLASSTTLAIAIAFFGCGKSSNGGNPGAGGATATGGTTSSGGTGTGGAATGGTATGGSTSVGGSVSTGGSTGTGGTTEGGGSGGGGGGAGGTAPRCGGLAATCGPAGTDDCCATLPVPGGTFNRGYNGVDFEDAGYPATVDAFYLDKYEVTVGRFRHFVNAGMGTQANPPAAGDGAHPLIEGSGWQSKWNIDLPTDTAGLTATLAACGMYPTWTDAPGDNESKPVNCLDWYRAFAFCAWDGGRLPTEAEWNYAASGGGEHRYYPWSAPAASTTIDDSYAIYCGETCRISNVGSRSPKGDGKWGQSDLAGNLWEWVLDSFAEPFPNPCSNCAGLVGYARVVRGGYFDASESKLAAAYHDNNDPVFRSEGVGVRCARSAP